MRIELMKTVRFHHDGLREDGRLIPEPKALCDYIAA